MGSILHKNGRAHNCTYIETHKEVEREGPVGGIIQSESSTKVGQWPNAYKNERSLMMKGRDVTNERQLNEKSMNYYETNKKHAI